MNDRDSQPSRDDRLASAAVGLFAGLAIGFGSGLLGGLFVPLSADILAAFIFGGGAVGALGGFLAPRSAFSAALGSVHFAWGFLNGLAHWWPESERTTSKWLKWAMAAGVLCGVALAVAVWF
jgi:hypothetical protein